MQNKEKEKKENKMEIKCSVKKIIYNKQGYAIFLAENLEDQSLFQAKGVIPGIYVKAEYQLTGTWEQSARYGETLKVTACKAIPLSSKQGIYNYLISGCIKGLSKRTAKAIVSRFGTDTMTVIEEKPQLLLDVSGVGQKTLDKIKAEFANQSYFKQLVMFLAKHGISTNYANKVYERFKEGSISVLKENPYELTQLKGFGFKKADDLAKKLGISATSKYRIEEGICYVYKQSAENEGHCYLTKEQVLERAVKLLAIESSYIEEVLETMVNDKLLIKEEEAYYFPLYYYTEKQVVAKIKNLLKQKSYHHEATFIEEDGITYDVVQKEAIEQSMQNPFLILTGGPGTGKTTVTKGIVNQFLLQKKRVLLAAPTGRAAKRMSEAIGLQALTIHRLLAYSPTLGFTYNEDNPLEGDVLIVDESSMIDLFLMSSLLKAVPLSMSVLLIGDVDQLPSVGPGNVLRDLIESQTVPVVRLTKIFRQASGSEIIVNAHKINEGQMIELKPNPTGDFFFCERNEDETIADTIVTFCNKNLPIYYGVDKFKDIQVLAPQRKGVIGINNLNSKLQDALNKSPVCIKTELYEYRLNDKVMQIKNNYDKDVFNGDIGYVENYDEANERLIVNFDGNHVSYLKQELDELVLAYAITVHKFQGCESPIVVMPIRESQWIMLNRNILYTAVTRAKQIFVLVGSKKAVAIAVGNCDIKKRNTGLQRRLCES